MRNDIRISLVQSPIAWEDKAANWEAYEKRLASLKGTTDIVLFPEMFTTGFSMEAEKLGFSRILIPYNNLKGFDTSRCRIQIVQVRKVEEAFRQLFG